MSDKTKISPTRESAEVTALRQQYDREVYNLRRELSSARGKLIDADKTIRQQALIRDACFILIDIVARYRRAIQSLGWVPPDDEAAIIDKIRKDLEQ